MARGRGERVIKGYVLAQCTQETKRGDEPTRPSARAGARARYERTALLTLMCSELFARQLESRKRMRIRRRGADAHRCSTRRATRGWPRWLRRCACARCSSSCALWSKLWTVALKSGRSRLALPVGLLPRCGPSNALPTKCRFYASRSSSFCQRGTRGGWASRRHGQSEAHGPDWEQSHAAEPQPGKVQPQ